MNFKLHCLAFCLCALPLVATAQIVIRQGSNSPPGTVFHDHWLKFKDKLESAGTYKVELNTNEPNEANLLSNLRRGRVDCAGTSLQGTAAVLPEVAVLQLPYLFASFKEVDHAYGKGLTDNYRQLFAAKGLTLLHFVEVGFVNMYSTAPLKAVADVQGKKFRATQSRASQNWIKAIGAEAVVLPFADLVPGLQTGLIRGGEAGVVIYDAVVGKAAPFYTLTQHGFDSGVIVCNKEWFDKLTPAQQTQVSAAWDRAGQIRDVRAQADKVIASAGAKGITVYRPSDAEQQSWRAAGKVAAEAVMATLPEAAKLREELVALIKAAPR
jgi:TRAP-type transport system periplasmic protein